MREQNNNVPAIRFEGFSGQWFTHALQSVADVLDGDRGANYPNGDDLQVSGHTLFLSASNITSKGFMLGVSQYISEEKSNSMGNGKLVLGDIILTSRGSVGHIGWYSAEISQQVPFARINSGMLIIRSKKQVDPSVVAQFLKSPAGKKKIDLISFGSAQPQLTKMSVSTYTVNLPKERDEQTKIGHYFQQLDTLIVQHQKKHDKLLNIKKALLEKLFPKQGATEPELRFKGFSGAWEERKLLSNFERIIDFRGRTPKKLGMDWSEDGYLALSALNVKNGFIDFNADANFGDQELYDKWMSGNELHKNQVLFTTEAPMGNVAQVPDNQKYILSQRTIAFEVKKKLIEDNFLAVTLSSPLMQRKLSSLSSGGTAQGVSQKSLASVNVLVPKDILEQTKIGNLFKQLDTLITQHQTQLNKLGNIKQACLEKMFV
ncbi:restriction endonuclease subunit S [Pontibacter sp. JAM-7]|uniref:restriction endonuclease subunit S n=1 Tax=Pontibacter sp. JAM-7 TaxID=3366581 RepID=UPI003AF9E0F1